MQVAKRSTHYTYPPLYRDTIGATEVMTTKTMDGSLAAFWMEGEYAFSVVGSKMSDDVFDALLSDVFVDMSEHFYGEAANPLARKTF